MIGVQSRRLETLEGYIFKSLYETCKQLSELDGNEQLYHCFGTILILLHTYLCKIFLYATENLAWVRPKFKFYIFIYLAAVIVGNPAIRTTCENRSYYQKRFGWKTTSFSFSRS